MAHEPHKDMEFEREGMIAKISSARARDRVMMTPPWDKPYLREQGSGLAAEFKEFRIVFGQLSAPFPA
jgi:hypothetical protein